MAEESAASVAGRKLMQALEMHEFGVRMMRENLRRRHPEAGEDEIATRLTAWLHGHPLMGVHPRDFSPTGRTIVD